MSALTIRIDKYLDSEDMRPPRVPARIYPIESSGKSSASIGSMQRTLVPISHIPTDVVRVDLVPGSYYVETVLPSGEILADSVTVAGEKPSELVLYAKHSPQEWFSWQQLVGNMQLAPPSPAPGPPASPQVKKKAMAKREAAPVTQLPIGRSINVLSMPHAALTAGEPKGAEVWKWLGEASSADALTFVKTLNQDHEPIDLPVYTSDETRAVYRLTWDQSTRSGVQPLKGPVPNAPRYFAVVPRLRSVELLSLPIPWRVIGTGREASIEIAVQQIHAADSFCASATARDEDLGMLLGFLSSGSLPLVAEMAETAKEMLYYKMQNPYAVAAGGYAMVGTALQVEDREWHHWIRNLMHNFPHIPDGAIQWAQLRLKIRRSSSDVKEATQALKLAYRRGLPFYSMGVRWLMEGLEWIARDDSEAEEMLRNVRRIAWRTNFQQPFTILRIGGGSNV